MADGLAAAEPGRHSRRRPPFEPLPLEKAPEPKSRRPKRLRQAKWPPALAEAVEALRLDNPMWGKRKIAAPPRHRTPPSHMS